jgi:hypothetical protein
MRHADYKYVNVAVGGVFNRKGIYDFRQLGNPSGLSEGYCTYFRYNDDMKDTFKMLVRSNNIVGQPLRLVAD